MCLYILFEDIQKINDIPTNCNKNRETVGARTKAEIRQIMFFNNK